MGLFAEWQPAFAAVGIATFPVVDKRPTVKNYTMAGLPASREWASRFGEAEAFGIALKRSKLAVVDVDTRDERVLEDAIAAHGEPPFIVQTQSGGWHLYYRRSGEGRRVRPDPAKPVDILGDGHVVAPPSRGAKGCYRIIRGCLADLAGLSPRRDGGWSILTTYNSTPSPLPLGPLEHVAPGERNSTLWRYLMTHAPYCDDADALIDVARTAAEAFSSPLPAEEVVKAARSAWRYEAEDKNWIARGNRRPAPTEPDGLLWECPDAFILWKALRHYNSGRPRFYVANGMADSMPRTWTRKRLAAAREALLRHGHITLLRAAHTGSPALYSWGR